VQFRIKSFGLIFVAERFKGPKSLFVDDGCDCRDRIALFSGIVFPKENVRQTNKRRFVNRRVDCRCRSDVLSCSANRPRF
jgi:hypothetical protein